MPFRSDSRRAGGGRRGERGTTLIESMAALALLALSAASMGGLLQQQMRWAATNHLADIANSLAAEELEQMRAQPYAAMSGATRTVTQGAVVFTVATRVLADTPAKNMKKVTVTVTWNEPRGAKNVAISTVFSQIRRS